MSTASGPVGDGAVGWPTMAVQGVRSHYQVLGVTSDAAPDEIRRAHRQLARVLHPDRQIEATAAERKLAERRMREVNVAWTTLSDSARRKDYDRELTAQRIGQQFGPGDRADSARSAGGERGGATRSNHEWDPTDPDLAREQARLAEVDPDEPELSAGHFWLLRRGPVVLMVLAGLVLFFVTAYAGGDAADENSGQPPRTTAAALNCVRTIEGRTAVRTSCESDNQGRIMTKVQQPLECPQKTSYVILDDEVVCVTTDPSVTSNFSEGGG